MTAFEERINRLAKDAKDELAAVGIDVSAQITCIKENRRAKKRLGCCKKDRNTLKENFTIEISTVLDGESDQVVKEIIIHELLHTCKDCFNHGKKWKRLAALVNSAYEYHIKTYADREILNIEEKAEGKLRYEIRCTQCRHVGYRYKRSKMIVNPHLYRCAKCGGAIQVRKI